ncbi:beta-N-acetylhexosaminidase [Portibacter lacus]|nr:family 20 glycosylhydrolase [Portibacter lacus]
MNVIIKVIAVISLFSFYACEEESNRDTLQEISIIPEPAEMTIGDGSFKFDSKTKIVANNDMQKQAANLLIASIDNLNDNQFSSEIPESNYLLFETNDKILAEGYELEITPDAITIKANDHNGFVHGIQTISQLIPISGGNHFLPTLTIKDQPRFQWRGLMLDVSRHFFEKEYILKTIERMSYFKLNTLHLHLIDDQGWRIEIKKYPKLTEVGAFRVNQEDKHWQARPKNDPNEKGTFGGFYTQEDIKEIVAHASKYGITVIPEIEMPAHVTSAIASYPEFSCLETPVAVPSGGLWPITDIYCAGKEGTFEFLEDVLVEVMDLFPSKYIHIGGDEATKTNWETCDDCQNRMKQEGLDNTEELQSYFVKRIEKFLNSKGRILIGWDEILEGGLAPGATVMSWRGTKGGWEASEQGHDVVMTPESHMYFNMYQGEADHEPLAFGGYTTMSKVYHFDPIVDSMSAEQKNHVLGAQANLWSEYITDEDISEYMIFPRLPALAEVLWSPKNKTDWTNFSKKINPLFQRLDKMDVNYSKSVYAVTSNSQLDTAKNELTISLKNEIPNSEIRYALNDDELNAEATKYTAPFLINESATIQAAVFENGKPVGRTLEKEFNFHKAFGKNLSYNPRYHKSYSGTGNKTLVNVIRGSKNFHDKQWLAWLSPEVEIIMDMVESTEMTSVSIGSMENQGSGIYFPIKFEVFLSSDGGQFDKVGEISRPFKNNVLSTLEHFKISFEKQNAQFIKVKITNLGSPPKGGGAWIFLDEITVE